MGKRDPGPVKSSGGNCSSISPSFKRNKRHAQYFVPIAEITDPPTLNQPNFLVQTTIKIVSAK